MCERIIKLDIPMKVDISSGRIKQPVRFHILPITNKNVLLNFLFQCLTLNI